jgi:hypothetical protein
MRFTYAEAQRAVEANVTGCKIIASVAVAVSVVDVLTIPSKPVAVLAAVMFVFVDHATLLKSLE